MREKSGEGNKQKEAGRAGAETDEDPAEDRDWDHAEERDRNVGEHGVCATFVAAS
jgi:hypothetical protein